MLLLVHLLFILLYIYQDGEEAPYNQQWVSMTERFRYPPKGYASHIPTSNSGAVGAPPVATTSRVSESDRKMIHLHKDDADFVDVIHTTGGSLPQGLGMTSAVGHADFYPNG